MPALASCARAQAPPEIALETLATGLAQPTAIAHAGDSRVFLTLQRGQVVVFDGSRVHVDYRTGKIWGATNAAGSWSARLLTPRATNQTTFGEDSAGEVYLATESGLFARIVDANPISPTVASVESPSGSVRGGEVVVVTGSGFLPGVVVTFGGAPGTDVTLLDSSSTRLSVVTPAHAAGTVDVVVTNSDGRSATLPGA